GDAVSFSRRPRARGRARLEVAAAFELLGLGLRSSVPDELPVVSSSGSSNSELVSGGAGKTAPHFGQRTSWSAAIRRDVFKFVRQSGQAKVIVFIGHSPTKRDE